MPAPPPPPPRPNGRTYCDPKPTIGVACVILTVAAFLLAFVCVIMFCVSTHDRNAFSHVDSRADAAACVDNMTNTLAQLALDTTADPRANAHRMRMVSERRAACAAALQQEEEEESDE